MIERVCPFCGEEVKVPDIWSTEVVCPACGATTTIRRKYSFDEVAVWLAKP